MARHSMVLVAAWCAGCPGGPGGGDGDGGGGDGEGTSCDPSTIPPTTESLPDIDITRQLILLTPTLPPECDIAGDVELMNLAVTVQGSYDNVLCGGWDGSTLTLTGLTVEATVTMGVEFRPDPWIAVLPHCAIHGGALDLLEPGATARITGEIELEEGSRWTTSTGISVPHYEITRSELSIDLTVTGADLIDEVVEEALRNWVLDQVDQRVSAQVDQANCLCSETAPEGPEFPVYQPGYDPR